MNFPTQDLTLYTILGLGLIIIVLLTWIIRLEVRFRKLVRGKDAVSLEDMLASVVRDMNGLKKYREESLGYLSAIEDRIQKSVQSIETVRFNPFQGTGVGGNQSFATVLLNERGDGVVISTLHARDRVSTFAKPVKSFASEHDLTEEEQHVISKAMESLGLAGKNK